MPATLADILILAAIYDLPIPLKAPTAFILDAVAADNVQSFIKTLNDWFRHLLITQQRMMMTIR